MKDFNKIKKQQRAKRAARTRAKILGTAEKPRLSVFRSNQHVYLQLIDDQRGKTIVSSSDLELKIAKQPKAARAKAVGGALAKKAIAKNITEVIYDKGGYRYHGVVKAAADGAREGGLKF